MLPIQCVDFLFVELLVAVFKDIVIFFLVFFVGIVIGFVADWVLDAGFFVEWKLIAGNGSVSSLIYVTLKLRVVRVMNDLEGERCRNP